MFWDACKMDEIGIVYAAAARELAMCIVHAVLAAVAAAVFRKMLQERPGAAPVVDRAVKNDRRRHHMQRPVTRPTSGSPVDVVDVSKDLRRRRSSDVQCSMHDSSGGSRQTAQSVTQSDSSLLDEAGSLGDVCDSRGSLMCSPQRAAREHEKTSRSSRRDRGQGVVREGSTKTASSAGSNRSTRVGPASMTTSGARHLVHATTMSSLPCIHEGSVLDGVMQKRPKMQKRPNSGPAKKVSSGSLFYANVVQKRCRATVASSS